MSKELIELSTEFDRIDAEIDKLEEQKKDIANKIKVMRKELQDVMRSTSTRKKKEK